MDASPIDHFVAIVPAGGAGTRLWPLSRAGSPKFLHDLTGQGLTLLQATFDRLRPVAGGGVMVVTGQAHVAAVREQLPELPAEGLLAEPSPRDSMAAIGLAAAVAYRKDPEAVIGSFAADHVIGDAEVFHQTVREAVAAARTGKVVTIGITPTFPATGFGYIKPGAPLSVDGAPDALGMESFVEKPDEETAAQYVKQGYLWNAGMFVATAKVLLDHLAAQQPTLAAGLDTIAAAIVDEGEDAAAATLEKTWPGLTKIAIDHAIAEPVAATGGMAVVPGGFSWDDVGDWHSLATILPGGDDQLQVVGEGDVLSEDANGVVVASSGRLVAVLGVPDVVVVDTEDAVLVTTRDHAQRVKSIVDRLKQDGRTSLV